MARTAKSNPWQSQGVSILPQDTKDILPIVGQGNLFRKLVEFREECLSESANKISGFFVLDGAWGVGKSRVGHEVCLEAISDHVQWIVDGAPSRVFSPGLSEGILPLFIRYAQVTKGRFGEDLSADNWIPATIVEGLTRLAAKRAAEESGRLSKNQDRLMHWTEEALRPKGWANLKPALDEALSASDPHKAARDAMKILGGLGIRHLLLVVDEIEDIGDVELDGLWSDERVPIDQVLLTVIPRVIKSEEVRQEYPEASFLLLCSRAVGDSLRQIHAIDRRTVRHEIQTNKFSDVEDFFQFLLNFKKDVAGEIASYPKGLKEVAFFAADRNFGWFNVIMYHLHANQRGDTINTAELMRRFAQTSDSVFNNEAIGSFNIEMEQDGQFIRDAMYGLLPQPIGTESGVETDRAARLLAKRDAAQKPLFARLYEINPPQDTRITTHLINCGFRIEPGAVANWPGEARFNLREVIDSLKAYSQIALPEDRRDHLLICEDDSEFTNQIAALSPYGDQAARFAPYLHGLLVDPSYAVKDSNGRPCEFLAPSFTFLQDFHRLNRRRHREEGFLRDSTKNSKLSEAFEDVRKNAKKREQTLLRGVANAWDLERAPIAVRSLSECQVPAICMNSTLAPLHIGEDGSTLVIYGSAATDIEIEQELGRLAARRSEPVVLLLEDQDQRKEELRERVNRNSPRMAPFVVIHNLTRQVGDFLVRLGLMGEAFESGDLRTSHFNGVIQGARQHLKQVLDSWVREQVEQQGLVLRPLFYGSKVGDDDLEAFAKGYAALLTGRSFHDVMQPGSGIFANQAEQERFEKMVNRQIDPPQRNQEDPRLALITEEMGERLGQIPRCLVTLMERCSHVQLRRSELERRFLFDVPATVKGRDVIRHVTDVMHYLGLVEREGDSIRQVSSHMLETQVKAAEDWLDSRFESAANAIRAVYYDEGARLVEIRGKEARQRLKEAGKELEDLKLDFIAKPWDELNRISSDGMPIYEQNLRKALAVVGKVRDAVKRVYDSAADRTFRYSPDVLHDFEQNQASSTYPLWKRVQILHGFYSEVDRKRRELIKQTDSALEEVDRRVPALPDGQKAFPTQALRRPLEAFRQELDFSPDKPNKTVTAGGSSFAINTIGYKICDQKYREGLDRLRDLEAELMQPGKLVAGFRELLSVWEGLRQQVAGLEQRLRDVEAFFTDAPADVRSATGLDDLKFEFENLRVEICEGGIRQGTDGREAAGAAILSLVAGLKSDLDKVRTHPNDFSERLSGLEAKAVQSLEVSYQSKHRDLIRASAGIRKAQSEAELMWPQQKEATYGKTKQAFDQMVVEMEKEGESYFKGETLTSFDVYKSLCRIELDGQKVDWDSPEYERHVTCLKRKRLLELRLK
jgi:hypothetical protein